MSEIFENVKQRGKIQFFFDNGFSDSELKNPADGGADQLGSGRRENLSRRFHV